MFPKFKTKRIVKINKEKLVENTEPVYERKDGKIKTKKITNPFFRLVKVTLIIFVILGFFIYKGYLDFKSNTLITNEIIIDIKKGDTSIQLANKLNINPNYLKIYIKNNKPEFELKAGSFKIEKNSNIESIFTSLKKPLIEDEINITILEGWNIFDIDEYLTNKNLIKAGEYITYIESKEKIEKLSEFFPFIKNLKTLEGFLYPDTYKVLSNNFKINVFVIKQLENFEIKVYNKILSTYDNETVEEVINLASIVEKEEKNPTEKATVAGILKKRLNAGWMIGADITVCYPHKLTSNECKLVISKYIDQKNEYNTRKMRGLPKTPIGNPSFNTINATLNHKKSPYWFYLHDTVTGKIYYGKTNAEHSKNKYLYLR